MLAAKVELLDESLSSDRRREGGERIAVQQRSTLRGDDRALIHVEVQDLSPRGIRFASDRALEAGAQIRVGLNGAGTQLGEIVWRDGRTHGCIFAEPLSPERMAKAFADAGNVVSPPFAERPFGDVDPPSVEKWPRKARLAFGLGGAIAAWAALFAAGKLIIG